MIRLSKKDYQDIIEHALSGIVVFAMFVYGGAKYWQFHEVNLIEKPVSELTGMQIMWVFYGYSKSFAVIIGLVEITGGLLILVKKTRLLGCLITSTILVNIILQDYFYQVNKGALKAAIMYQGCILLICWFNRSNLLAALQKLWLSIDFKNSKKYWLKTMLAFVLFVVLRLLEFVVTNAS